DRHQRGVEHAALGRLRQLAAQQEPHVFGEPHPADQLAAEVLAADDDGVGIGRGDAGAAMLLATDLHAPPPAKEPPYPGTPCLPVSTRTARNRFSSARASSTDSGTSALLRLCRRQTSARAPSPHGCAKLPPTTKFDAGVCRGRTASGPASLL